MIYSDISESETTCKLLISMLVNIPKVVNPERFLAGHFVQLAKNSNFRYYKIDRESLDPTITRVFWVALSNGEV